MTRFVTLDVVATPRHVELAAQQGRRAETRGRLFDRLLAAFAPEVSFADAITCRLGVAGASEDPNLVDAVDAALSVLRPMGVTAQHLGDVEREQPFAGLLRRAMNALDARLSRVGLVDARTSGVILADALARARPVDVARVVGAASLRATHLVRWERDGVWWRALATGLQRAGGEVSVVLPTVSKPVDASREADPFEALLESVAGVLDEAPTEVALERAIFGDLTFTGDLPAETRARVTVARAADGEAQARAAVLAALRALGEGAATERIALVVPRDMEGGSARATLERYFDEAGIPLYIGGSEPFEGALAHVAMRLLAAGEMGLDRRDVADLLRSRVLDATLLTGMPEPRAARAALLDLAQILERTTTREASGDDEATERLVATAQASSAPPHVHARRGDIARRVGKLLMRVAGPLTRASRVRAARSLFAEAGLAARASAAVRGLLSVDEPGSSLGRTELRAHARDGRALEALSAALDGIERAALLLGHEEPCDAETFQRELLCALRMRTPAGAARAGAICVVHGDELGEPMDLVVVLDANAGVLPARPHPMTDGLASRRAPGPVDLVEVAAGLEHASRVVVCYRVADDEGGLLAPSPLAAWLERGGARVETMHATPLVGTPVTPDERRLALVAVAADHAEDLAPHAARVASREREREAIHSGEELHVTLEGALRGLLEVETGGGSVPIAVTAVERALRCPFQGFAAQVLGAQGDDPRSDDAPDRREEGILVHEALAAAFTAVGALWDAQPRDAGAIVQAARAASDAVLARSGGAVVRATLEQIRIEVGAIVALAIEDDVWTFSLAEQGFGPQQAWPALVLGEDGAHVALRGRIDRVDTSRDGAAVRVIDYKRRVSLPPKNELGVTAIQVPLYALVARRALGRAVARGQYLSTMRPAQPTTAAFEEQLEQAMSGVAELVLATVRGLRDVEITPRPRAPKWCTHCGLDGACRRPRFAFVPERDS